jgi:hypothetical protein
MPTTLTDPGFKGLQEMIEFEERPAGTKKDVHEDLEEQFLEMQNCGRDKKGIDEEDLNEEEEEEEEEEEAASGGPQNWKEIIAKASRGVTDKTEQEYLAYVPPYSLPQLSDPLPPP